MPSTFIDKHGLVLEIPCASVVTKIFLKQEEIISLCWKNEYEVSVSDSSNEDSTIPQEDSSKTAPSVTANVETLTDVAAQDKPTYKGPRTSKRQKKPQQ
jgi:hypothetical protein